MLRRQFWALFKKNWIVLSHHWVLNLLRCVILPIGYGIFISVAQIFLTKPDNLGLGNAIPIFALNDVFPVDGSLALIHSTSSNITSSLPAQIISRITASFSETQLAAVHSVSSPDDVAQRCQQNFNGFSECFGAIVFNTMDSGVLNYTIRADAGLFFVDVEGHKSDFEKRILPLQWAVDEAIIAITTNISAQTPQEWPFTNESNQEQSLHIRLNFISGIRSLLVLALLITFLGIPYHLPGSYISERASGVSALMGAMGCGNGIRLISFHVAISLAYLPAWIIVSIVFQFRIFTSTSLGLVVGVHILLGLALASYSLFLTLPFAHSPALSAVTSTFVTILVSILALVFSSHPSCTTSAACLLTLIFPPAFYIFVIRAITGWELSFKGASIGFEEVSKGDPDNGLVIGALIGVVVLTILLYPALTLLLEKKFYEPRPFHSRPSAVPSTEGIAISIRNLRKEFSSFSWTGHSPHVTAINDLSLNIPQGGIFVLLGSNGAGKSTLLSLLSGQLSPSGGTIEFLHSSATPLGVVPQKNVFIDELTCSQTVSLFSDIKTEDATSRRTRLEAVDHLLRDVGLWSKKGARVAHLSGGMKRKLQLAIGMAGDSEYLLIDECTSGVDPLSRRALWRTLTAIRQNRTIIFTTHFLDEADLLADSVAVLSMQGNLRAEGTPVSLKTKLGLGYTLDVTFSPGYASKEDHAPVQHTRELALLQILRVTAPETILIHTFVGGPISYRLRTNDSRVVEQVLDKIDQEKSSLGIVNYDVHGSSLEDIFRVLMDQQQPGSEGGNVQSPAAREEEQCGPLSKEEEDILDSFALTNGKRVNIFFQALTIFNKRWLIFRRAWFSTILMVLISVCGSTIPLFYMNGRIETCTVDFDVATNIPLFLPLSPLYGGLLQSLPPNSHVLESPPNIISTLGTITSTLHVLNVPNNESFLNDITSEFRNLTLGGISIDTKSYNSLIAWEASLPSLTGPTLVNMASNLLWNSALNMTVESASPQIISANYQAFPAVDGSSLFALKWVAFFGATMGVFPAFFALYVANERRTMVQSMQFSNGLSHPAGLWLGHLMFDGVICVILASVITIIFATASDQFHGLGYLWFTMVLYGITSALFSYCAALIALSPLAAFAAVSGYQVLMFIVYLAGYLLTVTYAKTSSANKIITIIHFTLSLASPVASILRACLVSVNLFSLLCVDNAFSAAALGGITKFGGPILYLILYSGSLFTILTLVDSGSKSLFSWSFWTHGFKASPPLEKKGPTSVIEDKECEATGDLQVIRVSKTFPRAGSKAVNDISFEVARNTVFALLGPNGAGKTSLFNIIRGDIVPDEGEVLIKGISAIRRPSTARLFLGVCPQFTAIDSQLTVWEHLYIYGRLKGLRKGEELDTNISTLMDMTALMAYSNRLASNLSGGNQRKLALAISLIGNPSVVLIDEFSTGIDPKTKRDMWETFARVSVDKAIVMTTHSMEEAAALSDQVGIVAGRMLALGTTESLVSQHGTYEVHFSTQSPEDVQRARELMALIPGSRMADDVATRFEVPIVSNGSLASLFRALSNHESNGEYAVERASLESVFLKVIRDHNITEEREGHHPRSWWNCLHKP